MAFIWIYARRRILGCGHDFHLEDTAPAKIFSGDTKNILFITCESCMRIFNLLHEALIWLDFLCVLAFMYVSKSQKKEAYFVELRDQSPQL